MKAPQREKFACLDGASIQKLPRIRAKVHTSWNVL